MRYIIFDLDGVLRNLSSAVAKHLKVSPPKTEDEEKELYTRIDNLGMKKLEKIWANAPMFHGAKSLLDTLYENKKENDTLLLITASGFSYGSHYGTLRFLEQAKFPFELEMIVMSTDDKIEKIRELGDDCEEMVVIDDYDKVLAGAPTWAQCILVNRYAEAEPDKHPSNWKIVKDVGSLKLSDIL